MSYNIELYKGPEFEYFGTIPFMPVVQESLRAFLGHSLSRAQLQITVVNVPEDGRLTGMPVVTNLIPEFGYTYVKVYMEGMLMYRHPHPLYDVVTRRLQEILREKYPDAAQWKFRVDIPGMPTRSTMRPTPAVKGSVIVQPYEPGEKPGFTIRRIAEKAPPPVSLDEFGIPNQGEDQDSFVQVLLPPAVRDELCQTRTFSRNVEEGGFLVGNIFQNRERENSYLLEVTAALPAEYTGASFLHFTFTGDSFARVKSSISQRKPGERILGWYHTHLFPATSSMGLSSIDLTLHFGTFTIPWQIAGLINLDKDYRTLRFYVRHEKTMILCPYRVIEHERN